MHALLVSEWTYILQDCLSRRGMVPNCFHLLVRMMFGYMAATSKW